MVAKESKDSLTRSTIRWRPRILVSLALVMLIGFLAHRLWQRYEPTISRHQQYAITAEHIQLTPVPAWIRSDVRAEVFRDTEPGDSFSLLDDADLLSRIKERVEFHPWVESVSRVSKQLPARILIDLTYRKPVAAVETAAQRDMTLLPVDRYAVRLPDGDLTNLEMLYLPRITRISGRPTIGNRWDDERVVRGVRLAEILTDLWQSLYLYEIVPMLQTPPQGNGELLTFEITTTGGTRIQWGAAPGEEPNGESPFSAKIARLQNYATSHRDLGSIDGPELLDVRSDLVVIPKTAAEKRDARFALEKRNSQRKRAEEVASNADGESTIR